MKNPVKLLLAGIALAIVTAQFWLFSGFVSVRPGLARPASELGTIKGAPPSDDRLLYTAVVARRATLIDGLRSLLGREVHLAPRSEQLPAGMSWREFSRALAQSMSESQKIAAAVALREAGHRVRVNTAVFVEAVLPTSPFRGAIPEGSRLIRVNEITVQTEEAAYEGLRHAASHGAVRLLIEPPDTPTSRWVESEVDLHIGDVDAHRFGLLLQTSHTFEYSQAIELGQGDTSGSSAGLMLALELYDQLTGGRLAGNRVIAGTGALRLDGTVEPVDGIPLKIIAAERAGAEAFILPRGNVADAVGVSEKIVLVPVDTFAEALDALRRLVGQVEE